MTIIRFFFLARGVMGQRYNRGVPESRQVVVYSRKGCHLCEVVKESLAKLSRRGGFTWQEVDVDSDTELRRQFNDEVPVGVHRRAQGFQVPHGRKGISAQAGELGHPQSSYLFHSCCVL